MSTTYTIGDKMYGTGDGVIQNVTGYIPLGSKITRINPGDSLPLVDAFNIDWATGQYSYDGNPEHIIQSTGHLIEIINSKSSASGDVWDDIKDNAYITSQINIYASSSSTNITPDLIWRDEIENERYDGLTSYAQLPKSSTGEGWYTSADMIPGNNPYVFISSIYMVKSLANNILGYHGPSSRPIYLSSESGINGNFKSTVFVRSTNKIPDTPYNGAYYNTGLPKEQYAYIRGTEHSNANRISYNRESEFKCWSDGIPAGNEILWATTAIISDDNGNFDSSAVWSTPRQMTDTATYDVEFAKKQENDATPSAPNSSNSGVLPSGTKIWYDPTNDPTENWSEMYWRAERYCINGIWGDWIITRIKGEQGQAGVQGAFKSTAFIRTNKDISNIIPSGGNYNSPVPTSKVIEINGNTATQISWSDGIPNDTEKQLWSTWKTFNPGGDDSDWSKPVKVQDTQYYDVEFSYLSSIASNQKPNNNNRHKENSPYDGQIWFDPTLDPTDNDITGSYTWTDMIWRAERENINGNWSDWVITRIKGEDGLQGKPPKYYQTRYTRTSETTLNTDYYLPNDNCNPTDEVIINHEQNWTTYIPENTNNTPHVWQSSRGVDWYIDNNTNNWAEQWENGSTWSTPFMLDGLPGESQPIHPVLFYKWALSPTTNEHYTPGSLPEFDNNGGIILHDWAESPGSPSGNNKYLWMIQGEYKLNGTTREYQIINGNSYWTNPVCLSGEDGQPGQDGDDLEFIYRVYEGPQNFDDTTLSDYDRPQVWDENSEDDYKGEGEDGYSQASIKWTDNPTGVTITNKYEYCAYRRKTGETGNKEWQKFSKPFPWSIYGENGIDGDGVEYIYYRSDSITPPNSGDTYPPSWINNSNINDYFQYDDFPCIEEVTGSSWDNTTNTGKQDNSYIYHGWTDEPQGVSGNPNEKYEFVSVRKKGFKQGSTTEKEWKSFSSPTLWANYAEDGVATSMVLETDNDNVTVGVDGQNIVNNRYQTIAHIYLQYNGTPIDKSYYTLTLSFAKGSPTNFDIANNNTIVYRPTQSISSEYNIISINNSGTVPYLDIDIPKDMDMSSVNNLLSIQITATCNSNIGSVTNGDVSAGSAFTRIFNLTGVELSIEDIYQIGLSTTTSHRNPQNDGFEPISLWLNSFTSTNTLTTAQSAAEHHIFISYYSTNKNISNVYDSSAKSYLRSFDSITLNPNYNKHVFTAYYNNNVNSIDDVNTELIRNANTKFLDKEEVTAVYDGKNGVDSQSEEYIYLLTDDFDFFENNTDKYYDVKNWKTNLLSYKDNNDISYYQYNDYPFITNNNYINTESTSYVKSIKYSTLSSYNGSGFIDDDLIIGYWTDNPQGVSDEYPYEFRVPRNYLTGASENDRWQAFGTPQPWANWGHSGEDGDGVEYIYHVSEVERPISNNTTSTDTIAAPNTYNNGLSGWNLFQQNEYGKNTIGWKSDSFVWTDNPTGVSEGLSYEYVSTRKYKTVTDANKSEFGTLTGISINSYVGKKLWFPFSEPAIWAKYGKRGPAGPRGGSGLTIDLSNPTMQIAVNNNRLIKDNQGTTYTAINLLDGTQPISPSNFSISLNSAILNDENYKPFNISKQKYNGISYGFTIGTDNNNSYAYYQWEFTGNADANDNTQLDDSFFTGDNTLTHWDVPEGGIQLPLTISYNGQDYTKHLNIIGIIDGNEGSDAEMWELHCAYSTIHYNRTLNNPDYEPGTVQYSIKHVKGSTIHEILDFDTANTNLSNTLTLSYWFEYNVNENQPSTPQQPYVFGDETAHSSGSGIYLNDGTPVEKDTGSTANYSMDPNNISGTNELVITVNELDLRDANDDPISNLESTLLDIVDVSTNYKDVLSAGNVRYTDGSISNVLSALTDYVENGNLRPDDKAEVNNIIATINAVVDSLGSISHDVFVLDSNISTIYVEDKETAPVLMTREEAIAEYNASREPTNNESGSGEELQPGESAGRGLMSTPRSINIPNTAYTSTNGEVNISDYTDANKINVKSVHVALVRSNDLWDEDILEVVYDGIDGADGNDGIDGNDGERGIQGFTGPTVRYVGEFGKYKQVYDYDGASTTASKLYYGTGKYDSTLYTESNGVIYRDIVSYTNNHGTKYYAPVQTIDNHNYFGRTNMSYHGLYEPFGLCYGAGFINCYNGNPSKLTNYPTTPSGTLNSNWVEATNFDFVATKLLYADQALINQISTHDLIATDSNGNPVAGVTGGKKRYDSYGVETTLDQLMNSDVTLNYSENSNNTEDDPSNVRIFAGKIWNDDNSYSLTYAPFNVRQDGTAYMSKANIVGDINIGGQVNIGGNVDISGTSVKVAGDISVNTLTLNSGSFIINNSCILPEFGEDEHKMYYVMNHKNDATTYYITPRNNQNILVTQNGGFTEFAAGTGISMEEHALYTAISTYVNPKYYWIVTKTGIYDIPSDVIETRSFYLSNDNPNSNYFTISNVSINSSKDISLRYNIPNIPSVTDGGHVYNRINGIYITLFIDNFNKYQVLFNHNNQNIWDNTNPSNIIVKDIDTFEREHFYKSTQIYTTQTSNTVYIRWTRPDPNYLEAGDTLKVINYTPQGWNTTGSEVSAGSLTITYNVQFVLQRAQ